MPRVAALWPVELTDQEWEAYHAVSEYVRDGIRAVTCAEEQRARLSHGDLPEAQHEQLVRPPPVAACDESRSSREAFDPSPTPSAIEEADLEEKPTEEALDHLMGAGSDAAGARSRRDRRTRGSCSAPGSDHARLEGQVLIERLGEIAEATRMPKVIIFTQFRDTQEYLRGHIPEPWTVNLFHGQLKPHEKDAAVERFREANGPQILISTEAGGEGRNFQFCHMLVNYDLPWNPMKVEQRIGRIDRIGQKQSGEGLQLLDARERSRNASSRFSANGSGYSSRRSAASIRSSERSSTTFARSSSWLRMKADRALADLEKQLGARVQQARRAEQQLADLIMDAKSFRKDEVEDLLARRGTTSSDDMRRFVLNALAELHVASTEDDAIKGLYHLRFGARFASAFPQFAKEELRPRVTFDASVALDHEEVEFLAFGHPLVDALVQRARSQEYPARASHRIVLTDELEAREGWLFVYVLEFGGLAPVKELYATFVDSDGAHDDEVASWLLRRACEGKREEWGIRLPIPEPDGFFECAVEIADGRALARLVERQSELMATNQERLDQERAKLERFYEYRIEGRDREARRRRECLLAAFTVRRSWSPTNRPGLGEEARNHAPSIRGRQVSNASGGSRS